MECYYTNERNAQIVISLLKEHKIKKVIVSPGTTNMCLAYSLQQDSYFEVYSAPDERAAGYLACGLAAETNEPVVLSCTGATASRNYMPALTEAYYRKLPILVVTSSRRNCYIGHNMDQVTDRSVLPRDVAKISVQCPIVFDEISEWDCMVSVNKAILELTRQGGGPAHINLETQYSRDFTVKELPAVRVINRISVEDIFPAIEAKKIVVRIGSHRRWTNRLTTLVEEFCENYGAVVVSDHTGNYKGRYKVLANLLVQQKGFQSCLNKVDLMIDIGDIVAPLRGIETKAVWRVNPDGELRDTYRKLEKVFEMSETLFFSKYTEERITTKRNVLYDTYKVEMEQLEEKCKEHLPGFPFSNIWIAYQTIQRLPKNSVLHLGINNSLRSWNYFELSTDVLAYSNTGGYGIDGSLSTIIGASLANRDKLFFCVLGDLAFFYDMNTLGNRHVGKNVRILLINNNGGVEFKRSTSLGSVFGERVNDYIAATGHYGSKSMNLVKDYAQNLGFEYLSASNKQEYIVAVERFLSLEDVCGPMILEVLVDAHDEVKACDRIFELYGKVPSIPKMDFQKSFDEKKHFQEIIKKDNAIIKLYERWVKKKSESFSLATYLEEVGYRRIAIYGMGSLGKAICSELNQSGVLIEYVIEQNISRHTNEYTFYTMEDELPEVDAIIITPIMSYESIKIELSKKVSCIILSLDMII